MMGTVKQTFWLLALLLQSSFLFSTATVSGNLKDLTGTNVNTRTFVRFRLAGCSYQAKASGVALVTPYEKDFTPAADGSISGTLYRNDTEISCLDQLDTTWYDVTVYRDGKPQKPTPYRVAAATFNLNTASTLTTTPVAAVREAVVVNPAATQAVTQPGSTFLQVNRLQSTSLFNFVTATGNGGTVTSNTPVLDLSQTWNSGGAVFEGIKFNATCTACASNSELLDLQVGGTTIFRVERGGTVAGGLFTASTKMKSPIFESNAANPATTGAARFGSGESIYFRNAANTFNFAALSFGIGNDALYVGNSNTGGGVIIGTLAASDPLTADIIAEASLDFDLSAAGVTCQDLTISETAIHDKDKISLAIPTALASTAGVVFSAWPDQFVGVVVRACDVTASNPNPAAATVSFLAWRREGE